MQRNEKAMLTNITAMWTPLVITTSKLNEFIEHASMLPS